MVKSRRRTDGKENCLTCRRLYPYGTDSVFCRIDGAYARDKESLETIVCDKYMAKRKEQSNDGEKMLPTDLQFGDQDTLMPAT